MHPSMVSTYPHCLVISLITSMVPRRYQLIGTGQCVGSNQIVSQPASSRAASIVRWRPAPPPSTTVGGGTRWYLSEVLTWVLAQRRTQPWVARDEIRGDRKVLSNGAQPLLAAPAQPITIVWAEA